MYGYTMITDEELMAMSITERNETLDWLEREEAEAERDMAQLMWETHPARR